MDISGKLSVRICGCCGQEIRDDRQGVLALDDILLKFYSRAAEIAERRSAARIEIAHLACCFAASPVGAVLLDNAEVEAEDLADFAYDWLSKNASFADGQRPSVSSELAEFLSRVQQFAWGKGSANATSADAIEILFFHAADLTSASFAAAARNASFRTRVRQTTSHFEYHSARDISALAVRREPDREFITPVISDHVMRQQPDVRPASRLLTATYSFSVPIPSAAQDAGAANRSAVAGDHWRTRDADHTENAGIGAWDVDRTKQAAAMRDVARTRESHGIFSRTQPSDRARGSFFRRRSWQSGQRSRDREGTRWDREQSWRQGNGIRKRSQLTQAMMSSPRAPVQRMSNADELDDRWDRDDAPPVSGERAKRFYLSLDDDVVRAPSIGAKTAVKLNALGIMTVRDLIRADAAELANQAQTKFFSAQRIADWQSQARLVCTVPWLRGTHAQLLVGAKFDSAEKITAADTATLCSAILNFAATRDGQSILRAGPPPDLERIAQWVQFAEQAELQRVA